MKAEAVSPGYIVDNYMFVAKNYYEREILLHIISTSDSIAEVEERLKTKEINYYKFYDKEVN